MRKALLLCGVVLWLASGGEARAERTSTRLTREKAGEHRWTFTVKVVTYRSEGRPDVLEFTVTATPVKLKEPRLPDRVATLEVRDGKTYISDARLAAKTTDDTSTYTFRVAATHAEKSTFTFGETDDRPHFEGMGAYYWFYLADFVPPPDPAPKANDPPKDPVPAKTPFDGDEPKAKDYRRAFAEGYRWASGQHVACPTNPSDDNRHAIRGWVEGWLAGVKAGGQSDLPAKYAPFLVWKDEPPAKNPAPNPVAQWDVAKFPKLTGKLVRYIGHGDTFVPPNQGDPFVLDFATIQKLERLEFGTKKSGQSYLGLYGPLQLVHVNTFTTGAFASCRFTARSHNHALHIDVHPKPGRGNPRFVELFITSERDGLVSAAAIVECLAEGEFPAPSKSRPEAPPGKEPAKKADPVPAALELEGILYRSDRSDDAPGLRDRTAVVRAKPSEPLARYRVRVSVAGLRSELVDLVLDDEELVSVAKANLHKRVKVMARAGHVLVVPEHPELRIEKGGAWLPAGTSPQTRPVLFVTKLAPRPFEKPWSGEPITKVAWIEGGQLATLKRLPSASEVTAVRIEPGLNLLKTPLTAANFPALLASMKPERSDSDLKDRHHAPSFGVEFETADGPFRLTTYLGGFGLLSAPDGAVGWVTFDPPAGAKP